MQNSGWTSADYSSYTSYPVTSNPNKMHNSKELDSSAKETANVINKTFSPFITDGYVDKLDVNKLKLSADESMYLKDTYEQLESVMGYIPRHKFTKDGLVLKFSNKKECFQSAGKLSNANLFSCKKITNYTSTLSNKITVSYKKLYYL